jgi:hypothetical protein
LAEGCRVAGDAHTSHSGPDPELSADLLVGFPGQVQLVGAPVTFQALTALLGPAYPGSWCRGDLVGLPGLL